MSNVTRSGIPTVTMTLTTIYATNTTMLNILTRQNDRTSLVLYDSQAKMSV
jgi:hypothetical protein